jgi:type I restriction enzyme R subunit
LWKRRIVAASASRVSVFKAWLGWSLHLAAKLVEEVPTLEQFRARWITPQDRREMLGQLPDGGRSAFLVRALDDMTDYDLYDVLGELGYGLNPRTCPERAEAFGYKHADWLKSLPPAASETLRRLAAQFGHGGTEALEYL